jgi:hypothetical protein
MGSSWLVWRQPNAPFIQPVRTQRGLCNQSQSARHPPQSVGSSVATVDAAVI